MQKNNMHWLIGEIHSKNAWFQFSSDNKNKNAKQVILPTNNAQCLEKLKKEKEFEFNPFLE